VSSIVARTRAIADEVLFPRALGTDTAETVPSDLLDALADAGLYGMAGPVEAGGLALDDTDVQAVVEALASGCLSTTFVWIQHHNPVRAIARSSSAELRERWLAPLCAGEVRAGIARAGEIRGPPRLRATATADGYVLNGEASWVTGWGLLDVLMVSGRREDDAIVRLHGA
jgi:alkylation response protein AidB-like acyl-CoA dehydrogenase